MQTTQIRRGSSFQERDSDERFSNRSRRGGYGYGNNYDDDDRYNNRSSRYDEDDFDQSGRYGRSSRFQGDEQYYNEDYPDNRRRRAYDNSAEYDDEDYDYDLDRYDQDEDYRTGGGYDRNERWGRRDMQSMSRSDYRNRPRGQHSSGWGQNYYGNASGRRGYNEGGFNGGGFDGGGFEGGYRQGRRSGSEMYEGGWNSRTSSGRDQGFGSMYRDEDRRIGSMSGRAYAGGRRSVYPESQRSGRSRYRR